MEGRMSKELDEKWRELVAAGKAKWMPGMLTLEEVVPPAITLGWDAARVLHADEGDAVRVCTVLGKVRAIHGTALPDFTDPATLGCLLSLVAKAHGVTMFDVHVVGTATGRASVWVLRLGESSERLSDGPSKLAALVAALEAAP